MGTEKIKYPVNEYFLSVQGEGSQYGKLALFLRFGECNLRCSYCDTKQAFNQYKLFSLLQIESILYKFSSKTNYLIFTGGEPLLHDLSDIIIIAKKYKYKISVETNGTIYKTWLKKIDHVVVSPKQKSEQDDRTIKIADELKFVIQKKSDFKFIEKFLPFTPVYLVPVNNDSFVAALIFSYLKKNKFSESVYLGIQMHKVYNLK